jgi:hypothetical protein
MVQSLETEAKSGGNLQISNIRAIPIKNCGEYGDNKDLETYDLAEYSCDAVCDNCHCASF